MSFTELAKKISKRDKAVFDELIEYEKTGKIRSKERLTFTIDKSLASRFRNYCRENGYNMSSKIEKAIEEMMKK
jgi:hypothetical protein